MNLKTVNLIVILPNYEPARFMLGGIPGFSLSFVFQSLGRSSLIFEGPGTNSKSSSTP